MAFFISSEYTAVCSYKWFQIGTYSTWFPSSSIQLPLLFFIDINGYLNHKVTYFSIYHSADDTNLSNYNNLMKSMNKEANQELENLTNWLNASKICVQISKRKFALFKSLRKLTNALLKLKINGKRHCLYNSV